MNRRLMILCVAAAAMSCNAEPAPQSPNDKPWSPTAPEDLGEVDEGTTVEARGKATRRLTVEQLENSMPKLFGGETWTVDFRGAPVDVLDVGASILGEADFDRVTASNEEPNALFSKFMEDMATNVCEKALVHDSTATAEASLIFRYRNDVDENLRWLKLKFHNIYVPSTNTESIARLRALYDGVELDTNRFELGWLAVCVALVTDPEFMAY